MAQVVGYDGEPVPPGLDDGLHIVDRVGAAVHQALVDVESLLQLHDLLRRLQQAEVDVGHDARQAPPLADAQAHCGCGALFHGLKSLVFGQADCDEAFVQAYLKHQHEFKDLAAFPDFY